MHHDSFKPHIASEQSVLEVTFRSMGLGIVFGVLFAVANAYLALKVGQTISASIPAAIMSVAILRLFGRNVSILEHNIVQTVASVGEALAAGVVFTIPALILLGEPPSIGRVFLLSSLGGVLGVLFMIPMRRFLIVEEHHKLPYPEGTACAEILKAHNTSKGVAVRALWGAIVAGGYRLCTDVFHLCKEVPVIGLKFLENSLVTIETTPALLGVGYIVGMRTTVCVFAGGATAWWVIIPLIKVFGLGDLIIYPSDVPIYEMDATMIWNRYIRYIGAGAMGVGGLISLCRILPLLFRTLHLSVQELKAGFHAKVHIPRTEKDISLSWLILGSLGIILFLLFFPGMPMNLLTIVLLVILGFFFTGVTAVTVGIVGSSSNPVSGMTLTTLLITCLLFVFLGWTERIYLIAAMTMGCVACSAICMAGTTAQDLKTGFLLGATPRSQQVAEIVGVILPSIVLGYTLYLMNQAYGIGSAEMPAPQATLLAMVAEGVMSGGLPLPLITIGVVLGLVMWMLRVPILPFGLGVYLPLSLTTAMMIGGLMRGYVDRTNVSPTASEGGILFAAGLVGGDACIGIIIALLAASGYHFGAEPLLSSAWISIAAFIGMALLFIPVVRRNAP